MVKSGNILRERKYLIEYSVKNVNILSSRIYLERSEIQRIMHDVSFKNWPERFLTVPESKWFMFWLKQGRIVFIILKTCGGAPRQRACEFCNNILYTFAIYVLYKHTFQRCTEVGQVRGKYCRELGTCANSCDNAMMFYEKKWLLLYLHISGAKPRDVNDHKCSSIIKLTDSI